jgi:hypothetical protein
MTSPTRYALTSYTDPATAAPVFRLAARPRFSPLDVNLAFLARLGWNQSVDRLRFHIQGSVDAAPDHPLAQVISKVEPHLLIRRLDREEDRFASVSASVQGEIAVFSNDAEFARTLLGGIFLECPPSFHTLEEFEIKDEWLTDRETKALFAGMLVGALGWDPSHNVPDNIQQSLDEAKRSLEIANYRSCVAMSRRTLEAVLEFGYERLLKRRPVNKKGRRLMLNDMIQEFRSQQRSPIPEHLLHVADSIRLIGNVPGAHASECGFQGMVMAIPK